MGKKEVLWHSWKDKSDGKKRDRRRDDEGVKGEKSSDKTEKPKGRRF